MMLKRVTLILVLTAVTVVAALPVGAASLYSLNFVGERMESGDVRAISLGGSTHILPDTLGVLQWNPAMLARLGRVEIGASQYFSFDSGRSEFDQRDDTSFSFSQVRLAVPVLRYFTLSLGYVGRYQPSGGFVLADTTTSGDPFTDTFRKSGGLFSVPFGVSMRLTRYIRLGGTYSYEGGVIEDRFDKKFADPSFVESIGIRREEVNGRAWSAAMVFSPIPNFMVGATYESKINYSTDIRVRSLTDNNGIISGRDTVSAGSATLPPSVTVAASWAITRSWLLAGSAQFRDFTDFDGFEFPNQRLRMEQTWAAGIEYTRGIRLLGPRFPIRLGVQYQKLPYSFPLVPGGNLDDTAVIKVMGNVGTAFNLSGRGKIDINFQFGRIGSIATNGIEDRVFRIYFGIVGSEVWRARGRGRR